MNNGKKRMDTLLLSVAKNIVVLDPMKNFRLGLPFVGLLVAVGLVFYSGGDRESRLSVKGVAEGSAAEVVATGPLVGDDGQERAALNGEKGKIAERLSAEFSSSEPKPDWPAATLRIQIRDITDGYAISQAQVSVRCMDCPEAYVESGVTDESGDLDLVVRANQRLWLKVESNWYDSQERSLPVLGPDAVLPLALALEKRRTRQTFLKITDPSQRPLAGVEVKLLEGSGRLLGQTLVSDQQGRVLLEHPAYRSKLKLSIRAPGFARERIRLKGLQIAEHVLPLRPAANIRGKVLNSAGRPRAEVAVTCLSKSRDPGHRKPEYLEQVRTAESDAQGNFVISGLPTGEVHFWSFQAPDGEALYMETPPWKEGDQQRTWSLGQTGSFVGICRQARKEENRIPNCPVRVFLKTGAKQVGFHSTEERPQYYSQLVYSNASGELRIPSSTDPLWSAGLPPGKYGWEALTIRYDEKLYGRFGQGVPYFPNEGEFEIPKDGGIVRVHIDLRKAESIHGRLIDSSGRGISGTQVFAQSESSYRSWKIAAMTGKDGRFLLTPLRRGIYKVSAGQTDGNLLPVSQAGVATHLDDAVILQTGQGALLELELRGLPINKLLVEQVILFNDEHRMEDQIPDQEGNTLFLGGLPEGRFRLLIVCEAQTDDLPTYLGWIENVRLKAGGKRTRVSLHLLPGREVKIASRADASVGDLQILADGYIEKSWPIPLQTH